MKVIFLDVDGVLNSTEDMMAYLERTRQKSAGLYEEVEERPLKLLKEIVDKTGAEIVVSSSWRYGWTHKHLELGGELLIKLKDRLDDVELKVLDTTPILHGMNRGDEIRDWLERHPEVESFIILDDDSDMCEFTDINLVKTSHSRGLREEHVIKAIEMLNRGDKGIHNRAIVSFLEE